MNATAVAAFETTVVLHKVHLSFRCNAEALYRKFEATYGPLSRGNGQNPDISITWQLHPGQDAPPPPPNLAPILEGELVNYYGNDTCVAIRLPKYALLEIDLTSAHIRGQIVQRCLDTYGVFEDVAMISMAPLFRQRGWFPLHAFAAQSPDGGAALICGATGAGPLAAV